MIHAFVDTNIIIDLLADRKPFSKFAAAIFNASETNTVRLYTSSHSIATTHYLLKKFIEERTLRNTIDELFGYLDIIAIDISILQKSLRSKHKDFEAAIQIMTANSVAAIQYIVTRNIKDFKNSEIKALTLEDFCEKLCL